MTPDNIIPTISPEYAKRLSRRDNSEYGELWNTLDKVCDPELPGLTIWDLGILQDIQKQDNYWLVTITLTYSGCPATSVIKQDIMDALKNSGIKDEIKVETVLSPAWSTELISPSGKKQLKMLNIAPPVDEEAAICCPLCHSENTEVISEFGSTACKALYRCNHCLEPFDYFKKF